MGVEDNTPPYDCTLPKEKSKFFPDFVISKNFFCNFLAFSLDLFRYTLTGCACYRLRSYLFALLGMSQPFPRLPFPRFTNQETKRIFDLSQSDPHQIKIKLI